MAGECKVRVGRLDESELLDLSRRCQARALPQGLRRPVREDAVRAGWVEFLSRYPLDVFFTCTFSDQYAEAHKVYNNTSALNDFERWMKHAGLRNQYFVASEPHFCRAVPHLHGLMESRGLPLQNLWEGWFRTRGRGRFEAPRSDAASYYCSKYSLKEANPDTIRFRLGLVR